MATGNLFPNEYTEILRITVIADRPPAHPVPEASTLALLAIGLVIGAGRSRQR
jgi:hypothetical protein